MHMLTKPQVFYDATHKQALGYQNPFYLKKAQWIKPMLYDRIVISKKHDVISMDDSEETLILEEESRSKCLQNKMTKFQKKRRFIFLQLIIPTSFKDFNNGLHNELNEVKTVFNQMEVAVEQCSEFFKINEWQAKLNAKDVSIVNLRKHVKSLKGKNVVEKDVQPNNANVIALGMFRLNLEPLAPRVLKNKDAHINYIKHTQENADILWEIV
ncbi:hypothetical protein Tco_1411435 [Tanacetum coccineum]